jgi:ARC6-like, IMS domain
MKKLLLIGIIFLVYGCFKPKEASINNSNSASSSTGGCPEQPQGSLEGKSVKSINLGNGSVSETGQINPGKQKGFSFDAKKGQKLSYRTKDDICVWVYSPDNTPLSGDELKLDGKYTIQIAALKGSTSFTLEMGTGSLTSNSPDPISTSTPNLSGDLDQSKAQQVVQNWLDSKSKIFASPFDRDLAKKITTGPLYRDITKPGGPIDWLQSNNSYYSYSKLSIDQVRGFTPDSSRPSLKVTISESRVLYGKNGKPDPVESGTSTKNWVYVFIQEDGAWKIYDYKEG